MHSEFRGPGPVKGFNPTKQVVLSIFACRDCTHEDYLM